MTVEQGLLDHLGNISAFISQPASWEADLKVSVEAVEFGGKRGYKFGEYRSERALDRATKANKLEGRAGCPLSAVTAAAIAQAYPAHDGAFIAAVASPINLTVFARPRGLSAALPEFRPGRTRPTLGLNMLSLLLVVLFGLNWRPCQPLRMAPLGFKKNAAVSLQSTSRPRREALETRRPPAIARSFSKCRSSSRTPKCV